MTAWPNFRLVFPLFSKYVHVSSLKSTRTLCKCARHSISATRNGIATFEIGNQISVGSEKFATLRAKRNRSMSAIFFSALKIPLSITIDTPSYAGPLRGDEYLLIKTTFFLAWGTSVTSSLIQLPCYYDKGQPKVMFFQFDQLNSCCEQIKQSIWRLPVQIWLWSRLKFVNDHNQPSDVADSNTLFVIIET